MTYVSALTTIIQDRVNHLEQVIKLYSEKEKVSVQKEIDSLEAVLNILVSIE